MQVTGSWKLLEKNTKRDLIKSLFFVFLYMSIISSNSASYLQKKIEQEDLIKLGFIQNKLNNDFIDTYGNVLTPYSYPGYDVRYRLRKLSIRNGVGGIYEGNILYSVKSLIDLQFYSKMLKGSDESEKIVKNNILKLKFSVLREIFF